MARLKVSLLLLIMVAATVLSGPKTYADMTADDTFYGGNDILYYDADFTGTCTSSSAGGAVTSDKGNIATIYNYFVKKGLSAIAASAIAGNFQQESSGNPRALNASSGAYGIAQWTSSGGRKENLQKRANYTTIGVQLDYAWYEMNNTEKATLTLLKNYKGDDPDELALQFGTVYERYTAGKEEGDRAKYASDIYKQYGNGGATTGTSDSCNNVGNGNFVYYSQTDKKWASDKYGDSTIGISGCGPTSLAMIVATLFDKTVTPKTMANLGDANGSFIPGIGTSHTKLLDAASKKYGFSYKDMTTASSEQLIDIVKNGGLVYMAGDTAAPFTKEGHIVVLRGVTSDGKYIIGDPYRGESDIYDVSTVEAHRGSTFGISKE